MQRILLLLLLLFYFSQVNGQLTDLTSQLPEANFYHLKMPEGIEQNSISSIGKDSIGQMWFATTDGLIRYDGKKLFIYKNDANNPHTIGSNNVKKVYKDKKGRLWIATTKGLFQYRFDTDDFILLPDTLKNEHIDNILMDNSGNLWMNNSLKSLLYKYNPDKDTFKIFRFDKHINTYRILNFAIDAKGLMYITTTGNIFIKFDTKTEKSETVQIFDNKEFTQLPKIKNYAPTVCIDHENTVWIGTNFGFLVKYSSETGKKERLYFRKNLAPRGHWYTTQIFEDKEHNLWIGTWFDGVYKIFPDRKTIIHILPDAENPVSLSNDIVKSIFQDEAGYIWLGTEFAGINIIKKNRKFFVLPDKSNKTILNRPFYSAVADSNRIWLGTDAGGLFYIDRHKNNLLLPAKEVKMDAIRIFSLAFDSKHLLWIGTENGVYVYNTKTRKTKHFDWKSDTGIGIKNVISFCEDQDKNMWIGGIHSGLTRYDPVQEKFYRYMHDDDDPKSLSNNYVSSIFCDKNNRIWIGTGEGLNKFNRKTGNFTIFKTGKDSLHSLHADQINSLAGDAHYLWIATKGGGLNVYNFDKKEFSHFGKKEGLPSDNIRSIIYRKSNEIWLTTPYHIVKFNPENGQKVIYSASDGLQNNMYIPDYGNQKLEFLETFKYQDQSGYIYFGGIGGFVYFHPGKLPQNLYKAPVIISEMSVNGKTFSLPKNGSIRLKPDQNHLKFDISILNFIQPDKNQYAYKLAPFDKDWHYAGTHSQAEYYNLPHGSYKFYYKAANNDGVWNEGKIPLNIVIRPRFYQTGWFYVVLSSLVLLIIGGFMVYKWYLRLDLERKRKLFKYAKSNLSKEEADKINNNLINFLNNNEIYIEPDLSIQKLAKLISTKPNYLSQVINQYHGKHFRDFINSYRVEKAKELLQNTDLIIEAIAYDTGFNSTSTFYTAFKKETGMTPKKFRKQINL